VVDAIFETGALAPMFALSNGPYKTPSCFLNTFTLFQHHSTILKT